MKKHILALVLTVVCISLYAVNPIKEGNMISGHVIVKGTEENIPGQSENPVGMLNLHC